MSDKNDKMAILKNISGVLHLYVTKRLKEFNLENIKVLATVNGVDITEEVLNRTIQEIPAERRDYFASDFGRKQLLEQMINVELINAYSQEIGIDSDDFYRTRMEQVEKDVRFNATMNRIMSDVTVTDEEVKARYESQPDSFGTPETIGARHILVDSEELAGEIKGKLDADELSFEEAAAQYSSCPSSEQGGDLGSFGRGMMVPEFEEAAFSSPVDAVTEPVKTEFGYHIIKVYEKNESGQQPFEEIQEGIHQNLLNEKQQEKYMEIILDLRSRFDVETR